MGNCARNDAYVEGSRLPHLAAEKLSRSDLHDHVARPGVRALLPNGNLMEAFGVGAVRRPVLHSISAECDAPSLVFDRIRDTKKRTLFISLACMDG